MFEWIRKLYKKTLALAEHPRAITWLAVISFAESSFFPIPPDVILLPLCLTKREQAMRISLVCTLASILGGCFGYALGYFAFDGIGQPILSAYGVMDKFETFQSWYSQYGSVMTFVAGFSPIPYKVVTITAGFAGFSFIPFLVLSLTSRGLRFGLEAYLVKRFGAVALDFIDRHFEKVTVIGALMFVGGFVAIKFLLPH